MREQIIATLKQIEQDLGIEIIYACETGSRAWGYPSPNSDHDVFFIFKYPVKTYLSMDTVIDGMDRNTLLKIYCTPEVEYKGFDIYKTATLFRRSNPQLVEWICTDLSNLYFVAGDFAKQLLVLTLDVSPKKVGHYHYNQAVNNYTDYIKREKFASAKKYLIVLRSILSCMYLIARKEIPPFKFDTLLQECAHLLSPATIEQINIMIDRKKTGCDIAKGVINPILNEFIDGQIGSLKPYINGTDDKGPDTETLNRIIFDELGI